MTLQLYFRPLACSLASRIAFYEAGVDATYTYVAKGARKTETGDDYLTVNPMGQVPALRLETGEVMTENAVILQYIADHVGKLAPAYGTAERYRMMTWLNFVTTEIHATVFHTLFEKTATDAAKAFAYSQAPLRLARLEFHLTGREWLIDTYSVADIYLFTVLNWAQATNLKLKDYPALLAFMDRVRARPAVAKAMGEELKMYREEGGGVIQTA